MDYYYQPETKLQKKEKELNTKLIVYLGELPLDVDRSELDQFITSQWNFKIDSLYVKNGKGNKSFAYVKFRTQHEATRAIKALHLKQFKDCLIKAEPFKKNNQTDSVKNDSNLFIKNLPSDTTPNDLYELFNKFGNIVSVNLRKGIKGECIGYGYVNFDSEKSAKDAIESLNETNFRGNILNISIFTPKSKRIDGQSEYLEPMLLIKKLPKDVETEAKLTHIFEPFGEIILSGMIDDNISGKMGVIVFAKKEDAENALSHFKGKDNYELALTPAEDDIIEKIKKSKQEIKKKKYEGCNLVIKNLPKEILDLDLFKLFSKFGDVSSARVQTEGKMKEIKNSEGEIIDKEFVYESKGIGFVLFKKAEDALRAKELLNGRESCFNSIAMNLNVEFYDYNKGEKSKIAEMKQNMNVNLNRGNTKVKPLNRSFKQNPRILNRNNFPNSSNMNNIPNANNISNHNSMPHPNNIGNFNLMQRFQIPIANQMNFQSNPFLGSNMLIQQIDTDSPKISVESENLYAKVEQILQIINEDEKTETLGETLFFFLKDFIPQYKLNNTAGKFSDTDLCSKLTGILIKTDESNLLELLSKNDRLLTSLKDVIEKMLNSNKLG